MRTHLSYRSRAFRSSQVIIRFVVRMIVLLAFAAVAGVGFAPGLVILLWMSAILSAAIATFKRELPLSGELNHWDEATAYIALCCLVESLSRATL
jgi:hypothetical protein